MQIQEAVPTTDQYGLGKILAIWAGAAVPMGLALWVLTPALTPHVDLHPASLYLILITGGLVWQGVLSLLILRSEVRPFTWQNVKRRLWLNKPVDPATGRSSNKLLWWTIPVIAVIAAWDAVGLLEPLNDALLRVFPFLSPPSYGLIQNLAGPAEGQWWLLGVMVILIVFNYLIGEELLFRGILLPKMNGVFGRWDWVANGVLFSAYHLHLIWAVPSQIIFRDWLFPWITKRYRSYWMSAIVHGVEGVVVVVLFPLAILGRIS